MSSLIVKVSRIDNIYKHPNADKLDIAIVNGWQCVTERDKYKVGDLIIFIPPETIYENQKIKCKRIRGEMSFGLIVDNTNNWPLGYECSKELNVTKIPDPEPREGDIIAHDSRFHRYTDIENIKNFPVMFEPGEPVIVTEKIDGSNCRIGLFDGVRFGGSHNYNRAPESKYWLPWKNDKIANAISEGMIVFGELLKGKFYVFDASIQGRYMDYEDLVPLFKDNMVPLLGTHPYDLKNLQEIANSRPMEGIIIRPLHERINKHDRVIAKLFNDEYLLRKRK